MGVSLCLWYGGWFEDYGVMECGYMGFPVFRFSFPVGGDGNVIYDCRRVEWEIYTR